MQIVVDKSGVQVTYDTGIVVTHTKEQLQTQITKNGQMIDRISNETLRLQGYIDQITAAEKAG